MCEGLLREKGSTGWELLRLRLEDSTRKDAPGRGRGASGVYSITESSKSDT